jgi:hypothetical protein
MNNWKRIALVFTLIGSVTYFSYWSTNQFDQAFSTLADLQVASIVSAYPLRQNTELDTDSSEMSEEFSTSTNGALTIEDDFEFSFISPRIDDQFYIGCTYPISWQSSDAIRSLGVNLVDADTGEIVGPIASGLAKENVIEEDSQNLNWKTGSVWPGSYYVRVSEINSAQAKFRSEVFKINKMSENISMSEKGIICKGSGGLI